MSHARARSNAHHYTEIVMFTSEIRFYNDLKQTKQLKSTVQ